MSFYKHFCCKLCGNPHNSMQSTPNYSSSQIVKVIKSVTARQIFSECPQVKKKMWGGQFWTDGYFVSTVGKSQNETVIREYVKNQGKQDTEYKQLYMSFRDIAKKDTPCLLRGVSLKIEIAHK